MTDELIKQMELIKEPSLIVAKFSGNSLKRISFNRFEGHAIRWHDPNRQADRNGNRLDLTGEWFSPKTNLMQKMGYPIVGKPVNYQHGMHKDFGATGIGLLDFTEEDEIGQFVKGELYTREQYIEMLRDLGRIKGYQVSDEQYGKRADMALKAVQSLVNEVPLQFSGGFDPSTWIVDETTKHIDQSGLIHVAFTPTPADDLNPIITFKSMFFEAFNLEHERKTFDMNPPATSDAAIDAQHKEPTTEDAVNSSKSNLNENKGLNTMDAMALLNQIAVMLQEFITQAGTPPEEAVPMAEEIVEEMKAEEEKKPEEEQKKPVDEELVKAFMARAIAKAEAKLAKKANLLNVAKSALDAYKARQPANMNNALGAYTGGNRGISVGDNLKYAHLTALDMAMAWKMAVAATPMSPRGLKAHKATDFVSEEFYKIAMHKMLQHSDKHSLSRVHEDMEIKSMQPFKANEIDASDLTGQGLEWLGYAYDSQIWEAARNNYVYKTMLARGMLEKSVPQGLKGVNVPIESDDLVVYGGTEAHSVDSTGRPEVVYKIQPQTTTTVLVTPGTFRTATAFTFQLEEDSFVDIAGEANRKVRLALEENIESVMINGDTETAANTNINLIDGTPIASGLQKAAYLEFDGLRKSPLVTSTAYSDAGATLSIDDYAATWALLGSAVGSHPENIFFLIDFKTFQASIKLLPLLTRDVAGESAALFTGKLNEIWGVPVLMSGFLALSNSAGKIPVDGGTLGQIMAIYAPYWTFVSKRNITIEMQRSPDSETFEFYGSMRFALKRRSAAAAAITYNLTV